MNSATTSLPDLPHPLQVAAWQRMGGDGRAEFAADLRQKVRFWKLEALRTQHPNWSERQLQRELALIYSRAHT